jgi:hypothetical protein
LDSTTTTTSETKAKEEPETEEKLSNKIMANRYKNLIHSSPTSLNESKKRKLVDEQEESDQDLVDSAPSSPASTTSLVKKGKKKNKKKKKREGTELGQQGSSKGRYVDPQGFMVPSKSD